MLKYQHGKRRATAEGRISAAILPEYKAEAVEIAEKDHRIRTLGRFTEAAYSYYIEQYKQAGGRIDEMMHPMEPVILHKKRA